MKALFREAISSEIDDVHVAYLEVFEWLKSKGVRQWLRPLSREMFAERQQRGELFSYLIDDRLAAIVTLAFEINSDWSDENRRERCWWIKSLAVVRQYRQLGVGERVMLECEARIQDAGAAEAFLDCVDAGFLPAYYARLHYTELGRKNITYPSGNAFPMVLMKKLLCDQSCLPVQIVRARPEDAAELTRVAQAAKGHWGYPEAWLRHWVEMLTITADYVRANPTFVAVSNGRIIGFFALSICSDEACLDHLWVLPSEMGQGAGRALFEFSEKVARSSGASRLKIESDPHAEEFYIRMGAAKYGQIDASLDGQARCLPLMEKSL